MFRNVLHLENPIKKLQTATLLFLVRLNKRRWFHNTGSVSRCVDQFESLQSRNVFANIGKKSSNKNKYLQQRQASDTTARGVDDVIAVVVVIVGTGSAQYRVVERQRYRDDDDKPTGCN